MGHPVLPQCPEHLTNVPSFSGSGDTLSISDEQSIDEYVKYYHIKVSAILVPNDERLPMAYYDAVAQVHIHAVFPKWDTIFILSHFECTDSHTGNL